MSCVTTSGTVLENSAAYLLARVTGSAGTPIVNGDVSSTTVKVFDTATGTEVSSPTTSVTIYNSLQTDARWTVDATGYNVALSCAGNCFPDASTYRVEMKITPTSGNAFYVVWDVTAERIYSE